MLCQFSFENFRSYRDETTFDFQAENIPEFHDSLIRVDKCSSLLPVSAVYGPNGGGKTNLLRALSCLISTIVRPIHELNKNRTQIILQQQDTAEPYRLDGASAEKPTSFQIFFRTNGYEYRYFLSLQNDEIVAEVLDRRAYSGRKTAHIFERDRDIITLGPSISKKIMNTSVNAKLPFLSFLAITYNLPVITDVQEWFESCIIRNFANQKAESVIMSSEELKPHVLGILNDMSVDIDGYRYDEEKKQIFLQRMIHEKQYELPFSDESEGTKKLIIVLPLILLALAEGRMVVIDELDAKLHPKLLRYIVSMFKNPNLNHKGAQLLFTSHDMATMKNTVFRRDEIWFAAEDEDHVSRIYSLYNIRREDNERVNSTAAFDKQYMEGRYGADPYLQNIMGGGWN
ncbi:MAG: ATP-binding protein [Clostridia bacterium]